MTLHPELPSQILEAQIKAIKEENLNEMRTLEDWQAFKIRLWRLVVSRNRKLDTTLCELSEAIRLTGTTGDSYVEVGENNDGFCHKTTQTSYGDMDHMGSLSIRLTINPTFHPYTGETVRYGTLYKVVHQSNSSGMACIFLSSGFHMTQSFTSRVWQSLQCTLGSHLDMSTAFHPEIPMEN
ncbi:hypothetical protein Tco_1041707 [Tanacetum coccineum]|uniref:Uncharacterized protein n=1 Tax=Tanacetum coccineum TaxID=301880 RepID=A0ABQ5GJ66_9ASTR